MTTAGRTPVKTPGAEALDAWLTDRGTGSADDLAATLDVTKQLVSHWRTGYARPNDLTRHALDQMTRGKIPWHAWWTRDERTWLDRVLKAVGVATRLRKPGDAR